MSTVSAVASILALLWVAYALFGGGIQNAVNQSINTIEAQKVGGEENYALVQKIFSSEKFKETQKQQLTMAISQIEAGQPTQNQNDAGDLPPTQAQANPQAEAPTQAQANPQAATTLTDEVLANLKKDTYVKGNPDADITVMEFSDLECPFCARLHTAGTPKALADKYGDKINFVFKHFPLSFHANAQKASEGLECVGEIGGSDKFYAFIESVFKAGGKPTEDVLKASAKEVGVDEAKFAECLDSGKYADKVKNDMSQGTSNFGVQGTPNSIIINNKTKKYVKVEGAYPTEAFVAKIDELLK
jgi:protein-disulfide isomerase